MKSPAEEDTPLIKTEVEFTASRPDQMLKDSMSGTKKRIYSEDRSKLKLIHCAEDVRHRSFTFGDKVDGKALNRWREIATAIYHDNGKILDIFIRKGPPWSKSEIQRRLLEAVELNSLKCLDVLCKKYKMEEFSMEKDVVLFHRRYGLSFWPLDERPKETALHVLASKLTSTNAMEVLKKRPKFLTDFSDVPDSHGSTPLLLAIKCNNNDVINGLLLAKPDVNKRNLHEESPLHVAAVNDHDHIIEEILKTYSEPEERTNLLEIMKNIDGKGNSILYSASQSGMTKILNLIMEYDWWENCLEQQKKSEEQDWKSFVCNVCAGGCEGLAKIILQEDPGLLLKWKEGVTPLM
ncbi:TKL kinase, partial [Paramuricea clavata]